MNSHCLCGDHLFQKMYWKCLECRSHCKGGFCKNTVTKVYMMIQWWYLIHLHHTCTKHFCSFGEYLVTLFWPQIPGPTCWLYHPPLSAQVCRAWLVRGRRIWVSQKHQNDFNDGCWFYYVLLMCLIDFWWLRNVRSECFTWDLLTSKNPHLCVHSSAGIGCRPIDDLC